jgi:hypothetical protein
MAHLVFLLHGMGSFGPDWSLGIRGMLREIPQTYGYAKLKHNFALQGLQFVEVNYNDIFEKWRTQWREDAEKAAGAAQKLGMESGVASALLKLAKAPGGTSFFQTHLLDVALFHSFDFVSQEVQQHVRRQILAAVKPAGENQLATWSVVAHSLGSAVAAETLHGMFTHTVDGGPPLGDALKPQCVAMVANTSRLLWNKGAEIYDAHTRPGPHDDGWACWHYMDLRHALDPIPKARPFHPPPARWLPPNAPAAMAYTHVTLDEADVQHVNVHALQHHLGHPDIHVPLLTTLIQQPLAVSPQEHAKALAKWRARRLPQQALQQAQARLAALAPKGNAGLAQALKQWSDYRNDIAAGSGADGGI